MVKEKRDGLAIYWAELMLIALLVLGCMGMWVMVEGEVKIAQQGQEPQEKAYLQKSDVPVRQAELEEVRAKLEALQKELVSQQMGVARQAAQIDMLAAQKPALKTLAPSDTLLAGLNDEVVKRFLDAQMRLDLAGRMTGNLDRRMAALIQASVALSATLESQRPDTPEYLTAQTHLAMARSELEEIQKELVKQHMLLTEQTAALQSLQAVYPQLAILSGEAMTGTQPASTEAATALITYLESAAKLQAARLMVNSLQAQLAETMQQISQRNTLLVEAQEAASQAYHRAQWAFAWKTHWISLSWAIVGSLALLAAAAGLLRWVSGKLPDYPIHSGTVLGGSAILTAILFAYQVFNLVGVAVFGVLAFLLLLVLANRT